MKNYRGRKVRSNFHPTKRKKGKGVSVLSLAYHVWQKMRADQARVAAWAERVRRKKLSVYDKAAMDAAERKRELRADKLIYIVSRGGFVAPRPLTA